MSLPKVIIYSLYFSDDFTDTVTNLISENKYILKQIICAEEHEVLPTVSKPKKAILNIDELNYLSLNIKGDTVLTSWKV